MKKALLTIIIAVVFSTLSCHAVGNHVARLDKAISERDRHISLKQSRIDSLRNLVGGGITEDSLLSVYNMMFREYLTFNFDSAMEYVERAERIAARKGRYEVRAQVQIHRALSLATSGHFSHAAEILKKIDSHMLPIKEREEYFAACEWTYGVWAEYSEKRKIAPEFNAKSLVYLDSLLNVTDQESPEYSYRLAEKALRLHNYADAERDYLATLERVPVNSRLYAQAAYALALTYRGLGNTEKYEEWLVNAAISDQTVPLKENLALQQLAIFLKEDKGNLERANSYLKLALEDAIFYNNRLRMMEIAEKIPDIANVYQDTIEKQNRNLKLFILAIIILLLLLVVALYHVYRQRKTVLQSSCQLTDLNERLKSLNESLTQTNRTREQYVSLFMDLCAAYIEKLNRFPMILKLKVKQLSDVSTVADRYIRPSELEAREMFHNFDTAFLRLYPDFISQFNSLLSDDMQILPRKGESLNTDLRIYALVRMGISESSKIATLLFLSPQTIFNHRSQVRNRAKDRNSFERQVMGICSIIPEDEIPMGPKWRG